MQTEKQDKIISIYSMFTTNIMKIEKQRTVETAPDQWKSYSQVQKDLNCLSKKFMAYKLLSNSKPRNLILLKSSYQ